MSDPDLDRLVDRADLDGLVALVERRAERTEWDGVLAARDRCRGALGSGRQLWPVVSLAEYLLALGAPAPLAATVVVEGAAPFSVGPLTEVVASRHGWDELAPHLPAGPAAAFVAHERVLRGEDLTADGRVDRAVLDLPLAIQRWEPAYPLATYTRSGGEFPAPPVPAALDHAIPPVRSPGHADDPVAVEALVELAGVWCRQSNGRAEAVAVHGDHVAALTALGVPDPRVAEIGGAAALAWMAWAAASGGAHGRRRGMASGRFSAWWALAALGGIEWPAAPSELGEVLAELRWFWWDAAEPLTGWQLRLAVWDPAEGMAWAVAATDHAL